ncbi:MAG: hypothetical protein A2048_01755 [Deltaproteobacteria bacterium GWA2_45_12]|nr:MAG: hypothetical protein A2048_01755 [Deltaproteobacteria bacterium GWA2_45_12]
MPDNPEKTGDVPVGEEELISPEKLNLFQKPSDVAYPRLEVVAGPQEGMVLALKKGEQVLGRAKGRVQIHLDDTSLSRMHAKIVVDEAGITIQDLGSRNGTLLNGKKIKKDTDHKLAHCDEIGLGIYSLRLALKAITPQDLVSQKNKKSSVETFVAASSPQSPEIEKQENPKETEPAEESKGVFDEPVKEGPETDAENKQLPVPVGEIAAEEGRVGKRLGFIFIAVCLLSGVAGLVFYYFNKSHSLQKSQEVTIEDSEESIDEVIDEALLDQDQEEKQEPVPTVEEKPGTPVPVETIQPKTSIPTPTSEIFHAFLDIQTKPMPAFIRMDGRALGYAPLKVPVDVEQGREYEVVAEYDLKDIRDKYQQKTVFKADARREVFSINFDAEIGMLRILKLPRDVQFYLEGYYAYDKAHANPVRLDDIVYGKPLYIPFGHYQVELKLPVRLGASSKPVYEVRYHREYDLNAENRSLEISVDDKALQFFPAQIKTQPPGATLFVDGQKMGVTPFEGDLPLGNHSMKFVLEGFFDKQETYDVRVNVPYEETFVLDTSLAGRHIHRAKEFLETSDATHALNELVEALKGDVTLKEKAEIYYFLGHVYYLLADKPKAKTYWEESIKSKDFYYESQLGLAKLQIDEGNKNAALSRIIEVMLNSKAHTPLAGEAKRVFQRIIKTGAVIYISSEPSGARVVVNHQEVDQKTPVILSDVEFGTYRIEIDKEGFGPAIVKKSVQMGDFIPVFVTLKKDAF